jgi:nucleoside-diphosphate-sugar epimerase
VAIASIINILGEAIGNKNLIRLGALPMRPDDPMRLVGDVKRLKQEVGFESSISLHEGLLDMVEWWRRQNV